MAFTDPIHLPATKAWSLLDEFRAFAFKGNVIDLAIGVIVGTAFGNIVKSLVDNILMPVLGLILPGKEGYEGWALTLRGQTIPYGKFLGDVANFLIVAAALFVIVVKLMGWLRSLHTRKADEEPPLTKDQQLLAEIRDLLKPTPTRPGEDPPA